jgi:hypothetical protein
VPSGSARTYGTYIIHSGGFPRDSHIRARREAKGRGNFFTHPPTTEVEEFMEN